MTSVIFGNVIIWNSSVLLRFGSFFPSTHRFTLALPLIWAVTKLKSNQGKIAPSIATSAALTIGWKGTVIWTECHGKAVIDCWISHRLLRMPGCHAVSANYPINRGGEKGLTKLCFYVNQSTILKSEMNFRPWSQPTEESACFFTCLNNWSQQQYTSIFY